MQNLLSIGLSNIFWYQRKILPLWLCEGSLSNCCNRHDCLNRLESILLVCTNRILNDTARKPLDNYIGSIREELTQHWLK